MCHNGVQLAPMTSFRSTFVPPLVRSVLLGGLFATWLPISAYGEDSQVDGFEPFYGPPSEDEGASCDSLHGCPSPLVCSEDNGFLCQFPCDETRY